MPLLRPQADHLTHDDFVTESYIGQAHFATTGPIDKTCNDCRFFVAQRGGTKWRLQQVHRANGRERPGLSGRDPILQVLRQGRQVSDLGLIRPKPTTTTVPTSGRQAPISVICRQYGLTRIAQLKLRWGRDTHRIYSIWRYKCAATPPF